MSYLISVVIPIYNAENFLKVCLESIFSQKTNSIEVILIDDGSTDSSKIIIDKYNQRYKNILAIYQENQGVSAARNIGIKCASGSYVLFLDSDDSFRAGLFENLKETLKRNHYPDMVSFGYVRKSGKNKTSKHYSYKRFDGNKFSGELFCQLFLSKEVAQCVSSFIIKREVLKKYRIDFNELITLGEDVAFQIKAMSVSESVLYLANEYFIYNYNPNSQTNQNFKKSHLSCVNNYQDIARFFIQLNLTELISFLNFYYQYMFFYELQFFINSTDDVLQEYLLSDKILCNDFKFSFNIYVLRLYILKSFYKVDRKFTFRLLKK